MPRSRREQSQVGRVIDEAPRPRSRGETVPFVHLKGAFVAFHRAGAGVAAAGPHWPRPSRRVSHPGDFPRLNLHGAVLVPLSVVRLRVEADARPVRPPSGPTRPLSGWGRASIWAWNDARCAATSAGCSTPNRASSRSASSCCHASCPTARGPAERSPRCPSTAASATSSATPRTAG
jgi:hypothetical protein